MKLIHPNHLHHDLGAAPRSAIGLGIFLVLLAAIGCRPSISHEQFAVTQVPLNIPADFQPRDLLDQIYPPGSRVVLVSTSPAGSVAQVKVLSASLHAAGGPVIRSEGDQLLFVGKATPDSQWQIYHCSLNKPVPRAHTSMPSGAMDPVFLPDGRIAFSAPVPPADQHPNRPVFPQLYAQRTPEQSPTQLTYGLAGATDATLLRDGRILFVSGGSAYAAVTNHALFTINTDGTELSAFAAQHDARTRIRRPRESDDGRVFFLSHDIHSTGSLGTLEQVLTARPFSSRAPVDGPASVHAAEPATSQRLFVTKKPQDRPTYGIYTRTSSPTSGVQFRPTFDDPDWHEVDVALQPPGPRPMGRLSTVTESESTGRLLCLDANYRDNHDLSNITVATSVRLIRAAPNGELEPLGQIPLQPDGSFLVEVPANTLLGLETLDDAGRVVAKLAPTFWVRPGENRSCIGCHEPHNSCPENRRPLAVAQPPYQLPVALPDLAQPSAHQP